jgi:signal transduction histidine kinase
VAFLDGDGVLAGGGGVAVVSAELVHALLVDDAEIEFRSLQHMLQKLATPLYRLDWAASYAEGVAAFQRDRHDVYLIDFKLGPDSGLDLIRAAREQGVMKPIILLTAYGAAAVDAAATEIGANDYLVKGEFDAVSLDRAVRYATRQAQNIVELERRLAETRAAVALLQLETERRTLAEAELSNVLGRMVSDQEAERRRITRELHDNIGQSLTLLQLGLGSLKACPVAGCESAASAAALLDVTRHMSVELHRLAWEIRPAALDDLGLEAAIGQLAADWGKHCGLTFRLHSTLGARRLPSDVEIAIYRVVQEAITNVVRHSEARQVGIILKVRDNEAICIIEDDGQGLERDQSEEPGADKKRLGLLGMRERLALVRGTLELESARGQGATVFLRVPL